MRYKVARKLQEAFNGMGVEVSASHNTDHVNVTASKVVSNVQTIPLQDFHGKTDDEQADMLMVAAQKAVSELG